MAKKTFADLKKEILAAKQPDPVVLATMKQAVITMLANLDDFKGVALKRDQIEDLITALIEECYPGRTIRLIIEEDACIDEDHLLLGEVMVGRAPGLYKVQVTWSSGQTVFYFKQVPTGNLRQAVHGGTSQAAADDSTEG